MLEHEQYSNLVCSNEELALVLGDVSEYIEALLDLAQLVIRFIFLPPRGRLN